MTGNLNYMVRMTCDLENYIVAVERIKEYCEIVSEVRYLRNHQINHAKIFHSRFLHTYDISQIISKKVNDARRNFPMISIKGKIVLQTKA